MGKQQFCSSKGTEYFFEREKFSWRKVWPKIAKDPYDIPRGAPETVWDRYVKSLSWHDESLTATSLEAIAETLRASSAGEPNDDRGFLEIIEKLGIDAVVPDTWERFEGLVGREKVRVALADVRSLIGYRLRQHYRLAREAPLRETRLRSARILKSVGAVLAGDGRGKRSGSAEDVEKVRAYYSGLFDLENAAKHLRCDCLKGRSQGEKIQTSALAFGIPPDQFREYLNVDENGVPKGRRLHSAKRMVRIWIAKRDGVTEQTLSNLLTLGPVRPRKGSRK